jgi:hypothetical protein
MIRIVRLETDVHYFREYVLSGIPEPAYLDDLARIKNDQDNNTLYCFIIILYYVKDLFKIRSTGRTHVS